MNTCPSTFFGVYCQKQRGHTGDHLASDSSGHITLWTDHAADKTEQ